MSEASDWDPLPEAERIAHPGELGVDRTAPPAAAEPAPPVPPVRPEPPEPPDAAAVAAFRALQQRCAAAPPAQSLVAEVQHRQQRAARRRAAATAPFAAAARPLQSALQSADDVPLPLELEAPPDRDPREDEAWFRALPEAERERLRAHWWHERHRHDGQGLRVQRRLGRAVVHGGALFFVLSLLLVMLIGGIHLVPVLTAGGAVAAGLAALCGGGRFVYACAGGVVFVLVLGPMVFSNPFLMMALVLCVYAMACLGLDGEMRRSGGFAEP